MHITLINLEKIIPYKDNPRVNESAILKVKDSIAEFGFRQPIVVDKDMVIIVGHTRLAAAKMLGMKSAPVHIAKGLSKAQVKAYRIADNRLHEDSIWEDDLLKKELEQLKNLEFGLQITGFNNKELERLIEGLEEENKADSSKELDISKFDNFDHQCPKCGFEWS